MSISKYVYLLFSISIVLIISCSEKDTFHEQVDMDSGFSSVAVFNAIPNSDELILSIGQGLSQKSAIASSDNLAFGKHVNYRNWFSGGYDVFIQSQGEGGKKEDYSKRYSLSSGKFYSIFLYRKKELQSVLTEDNIIRPHEGKVKIRIAHFNQDLSNIDVISVDTRSKVFQHIAFGTVTDFIEVAINSFNNLAIESNDGALNWRGKDNFELEDKGIYTILVKGHIESTDSYDYITVIKQ